MIHFHFSGVENSFLFLAPTLLHITSSPDSSWTYRAVVGRPHALFLKSVKRPLHGFIFQLLPMMFLPMMFLLIRFPIIIPVFLSVCFLINCVQYYLINDITMCAWHSDLLMILKKQKQFS